MIEQIVCKYCGHPGTVVKIDDMYYARCTHCKKWSPFEFLATRPSAAIKNWNEFNTRYSKLEKEIICK